MEKSPSQCRSALVASVAQALTFAIEDPSGHSFWALSQQHESPSKRRRGVNETKQSATVFDSSAIPPIGIERYLLRLSANFKCSDAAFVAALVLVDRLLEYDGGRLPLTTRNVHRVFLAALVVSVKYHEDLVYTNGHYAKAGGVHLREVNRLERVLIMALDFDLRIAPEQYETYEAALTQLYEGGHLPRSAPIAEESLEGSHNKPQEAKGAVTPSPCADLPSHKATASAPPKVPTNSLPRSAVPEAVPREDSGSEATSSTHTTPSSTLSRAAPTSYIPTSAATPRLVFFGSGGYTSASPCTRHDMNVCAPWVTSGYGDDSFDTRRRPMCPNI